MKPLIAAVAVALLAPIARPEPPPRPARPGPSTFADGPAEPRASRPPVTPLPFDWLRQAWANMLACRVRAGMTVEQVEALLGPYCGTPLPSGGTCRQGENPPATLSCTATGGTRSRLAHVVAQSDLVMMRPGLPRRRSPLRARPVTICSCAGAQGRLAGGAEVRVTLRPRSCHRLAAPHAARGSMNAIAQQRRPR